MPTLTAQETGTVIDLSTRERLHWFIGRGSACDIIIPDAGLSRYHATIFRVHDRFCVVDHSLNGTHLRGESEDLSESTRLPTISSRQAGAILSGKDDDASRMQDTAEIDVSGLAEAADGWRQYTDLSKSHAAFRAEQLSTRLPRVVGYEPHALVVPEDLHPLLEMVYSPDGADALASMGRTLHPNVQLVLIGTEHFHMQFKA